MKDRLIGRFSSARSPSKVSVVAATGALMLLTGCAVDGPQVENRPPREIALRQGAQTTEVAAPALPREREISAHSTEPHEEKILHFGEASRISTLSNEGEVQLWSVVVFAPESRSVEFANLSSPTGEIDHFDCYGYELTFLGSSVNSGSSDLELQALPDERKAIVSIPELFAVNDEGETANRLRNDASTICGVPVEEQVPMRSARLEEGKLYRGAVASFVYTDRLRGIPSTGIELIPDASIGGEENHAYTYWF